MPSTNYQNHPRFYGRRIGRPFSQRQHHLLNDILPTLELTDVSQLPPAPWSLEIGFGRGEHLVAQAQQHPDRLFIGAEAFLNGVIGLVDTVLTQDVRNIRVWPKDIRLLLPQLPPQCLSQVYILFPDPWPKERHHQRRLLSAEFLDTLYPLLTPCAEVRFASDHADYVSQVTSVFAADARFSGGPISRLDADQWPQTRYERKALAAGIKCNYFIYTVNS